MSGRAALEGARERDLRNEYCERHSRGAGVALFGDQERDHYTAIGQAKRARESFAARTRCRSGLEQLRDHRLDGVENFAPIPGRSDVDDVTVLDARDRAEAGAVGKEDVCPLLPAFSIGRGRRRPCPAPQCAKILLLDAHADHVCEGGRDHGSLALQVAGLLPRHRLPEQERCAHAEGGDHQR